MQALAKIMALLPGFGSDPDSSDRRSHSRQTIDCLAIVKVGAKSFAVQVENVSGCGAFLSPRLEVSAGSYLTLRIPEASVTTRARVVRHTGGGTGIYFDDSSASRRILDKFSVS